MIGWPSVGGGTVTRARTDEWTNIGAIGYATGGRTRLPTPPMLPRKPPISPKPAEELRITEERTSVSGTDIPLFLDGVAFKVDQSGHMSVSIYYTLHGSEKVGVIRLALSAKFSRLP